MAISLQPLASTTSKKPSEVADSESDDLVAVLNAVSISAQDLQAAEAAQSSHSEEDKLPQAGSDQRATVDLEISKDRERFVTLTRRAALLSWRRRYDGNELTPAMFEAAAAAPLVQGEHGSQFQTEAFDELVAFVEALPF